MKNRSASLTGQSYVAGCRVDESDDGPDLLLEVEGPISPEGCMAPWFRCVPDFNEIVLTNADRSFSKLGVASIRVACSRRRRPDLGKRNTER